MVLLVDNKELPAVPGDLAEFYSQHPMLLREAKRLAARVPIKVDTTGVLYVRQKQWAATQPGEGLDNSQVGQTHTYHPTLVNIVYFYQFSIAMT